MRYVDAHFHLDFFPNPRSVAKACDLSCTYTIAVTNLPAAFENTARLVAGCDYVRPAAGLHPELVAEHPRAIDELCSMVHRVKYVGEVGLDYVKASSSDRQAQRRALERVLDRCEGLGGRVLSVHTRRAENDAIELLGAAGKCKVILHWFSGSLTSAARAVASGCFFSVNSAMARSASGKRIIAAIPDDRLLTETDGPFVKHDGREARPSDVASILPVIALVRNQTPEEVRAMILQNFRRAVTI